MSQGAEPEQAQSKRPKDTKFRQQNLPAWKPVLTPRTVLPTFFAIGVIFLAVGGALYAASDSVDEIEVSYTRCTNGAGDSCADLLSNFSNGFTNHTGQLCTCNVQFTVNDDFPDETVYLYYRLSNFFQNHRRYVKSRSDAQLRSTTDTGNADCDPLNTNGAGTSFAPCGLIANSLFNDTIQVFRCDDASCTTRSPTPIAASGNGIAWKSDRDVKFQNPDHTGDLCTAAAFTGTVKPPNWPVETCELGLATPGTFNPWSPDFGSNGRGYENEDFIVWMRTAALPTFRKLYRKLAGSDLTAGTYQAEINYNYPVISFDGTKSFVISTTSYLGGQNPFLGICYIVVGALCIAVGLAFVVLQMKKGRKLGDDRYLKWDNN